jgi:predicted RNA-binding Zn-ribbon protein involved in translation (DUF1610 family)
MVKTWSSEQGADETCPKCGSVYRVTVSRLPSRDSDRFVCEVCGEVVKSWRGTHSYEYELKQRGTPPEK